MGQSKDYKASGAKKWLVIFGILVLIAVIVVGIVLFIPANTYSMIEALQENEAHFLMKDTEEQNDFNEFTIKLKSSEALSYYTEEINNVLVITDSLSDVLSFYNNYMVFAKSNKTLSSNTKSINKYISEANKIQKNIDNLLVETKKLDTEATSYLKNAWIDFRKEFVKYMDNYYKMFTSLYKCYQGCFDLSYSNNAASKRILNAVNDYVYCIMMDYKSVSANDKKDSLYQGNYSYTSSPKITWFKAFVDKCVVDNTEITTYLYTPSLQSDYAKYDTFFTTYKENDFRRMIKAINSTDLTNPYGNVEDDANLFEAAKDFLDRRA